eukprot:CAMPEP_0175063522 /NCGR_PEP_ID=MMETSP0052_2-20121109/14805_1 /TAXON_ID=51329 ORGANISM="Polytomella parva, Strain SAG 63-3" /NCGR_SAMPLE_ID=MMETSP0052_2 /ASSEMBLY_ACC=CAM_ASM_000194 /LENGTH=654 /DNA_ID=CAMNT_0016329733 /DNA_START=68 /DNA_END=2029 /DNA_ORIENTATION=-
MNKSNTANLDADTLAERLKSLQASIKNIKSGKAEASVLAFIQDCFSVLASTTAPDPQVTPALKCVDEVLGSYPQAITFVRLEGGIKIISKHLRGFSTSPNGGLAATLCARLIVRACTNSPLAQQALTREKGVAGALISLLSIYCRDTNVVSAAADCLCLMMRTSKGASLAVMEAGFIGTMKDLLLHFMGSWTVFGVLLKILKNAVKFDNPRQTLLTPVSGGGSSSNRTGGANNGTTSFGPGVATTGGHEITKFLMGVARLLHRVPEQRKLLKRVTRTIWLLNQHILAVLPDLEPTWILPNKDCPHLATPSALECTDPIRHQELFPEVYGLPPQVQQQVMQLQSTLNESVSSGKALGSISSFLSNNNNSSISNGSIGFNNNGSITNSNGSTSSSLSNSQLPQFSSSSLGLPSSASQSSLPSLMASHPQDSGAASMSSSVSASNATTSYLPSQPLWQQPWLPPAAPVRGFPPLPPGTVPTAIDISGAAVPSKEGPLGWLSAGWLSTSSTSKDYPPEPFHGYGGSLGGDMMMHDLQRLVNSSSVLNRVVYMNDGPMDPPSMPHAPDGAPLPWAVGSDHLSLARRMAGLSMVTGGLEGSNAINSSFEMNGLLPSNDVVYGGNMNVNSSVGNNGFMSPYLGSSSNASLPQLCGSSLGVG